ncbi:hypothetical protein [Nonomuraea sp. NPDC049784]
MSRLVIEIATHSGIEKVRFGTSIHAANSVSAGSGDSSTSGE